jgi:hypothetical protein
MLSEDGQLTETCKGSKCIQIGLHWTVLKIIILKYNCNACIFNLRSLENVTFQNG